MTEQVPSDVARAVHQAAGRLGPFAGRLSYFSVASSTNDVATRLAADGAADGTTVLAAAQTAGRGRRGHEWFSPPDDGLYFSIVLRHLGSAPMPPPVVTLMAGVAVAEALRDSTGLAAELKWPNDVVVPSDIEARGVTAWRKVAGILAEAPGATDIIILGIGINIRRTEYPAALAARASSIEAEVAAPVDRAAVFVAVLEALARWRKRFLAGDRDPLLARWRELAPTSVGAPVAWGGDSARRHGVTAGLASDGALLVKRGRKTERIVGGELTWL